MLDIGVLEAAWQHDFGALRPPRLCGSLNPTPWNSVKVGALVPRPLPVLTLGLIRRSQSCAETTRGVLWSRGVQRQGDIVPHAHTDEG